MNRLSNRMESDTSGQDNRDALLDRIERMTELPLLVLAFAMVPLLAAPLFWDLSPVSKAVAYSLDMLIWALFAADLVVRVAISPRRIEYLRGHWLEFVSIVAFVYLYAVLLEPIGFEIMTIALMMCLLVPRMRVESAPRGALLMGFLLSLVTMIVLYLGLVPMLKIPLPLKFLPVYIL